MPPPTPSTATRPPGFSRQLAAFRRGFDREIEAWLAAKRHATAGAAPEAVSLVATLGELMLAGGKRLRPALVHHAYLAAGGPAPEEVLPLALASEFLHTYLLVHDDLMDHAEVRRGVPTAHVVFSRRHRDNRWRGDSADYGRSLGILVGDLAAAYASELFAAALPADAERRQALERCFATMSQEVIHGQHLELMVSFSREPSEEELLRVLALKSGRYSIERPIELGALAAGAPGALLTALTRYGAALGEAFQLRDDLLGIFGDREEVGKPVGGDLAEGKFTFLVHHARKGAPAEDRAWLDAVRGRADIGRAEVERARRIMEASGAVAEVKAMIGERVAAARRSLEEAALPPGPDHAFFAGLIDYSQERRT